MGSLNSFGLWGGMAALGVAVPVIIHLLYRKQRKQTPWAAMELLRKALVDRSGQVKLEDFIILLLRCLALVLIAFALLRPTMTSDNNDWLGEQSVGMVVAIDASFSMSHGEYSRFEKAIARSKQIFATAKEGDPVTLVMMSKHPEVLVRSTGYESEQITQLLETKAKPTSYRLNLEQNIEQLAQLASEIQTSVKECYLITDAQESDWATLSAKGKQTLQQLKRDTNLFVVPVQSASESNLSLTQLKYTSGALRKSEVARFTVTVRNQGRQMADGRNVEFYLNDTLVSRQAVGQLEAGEVRDLSFFASFDHAGQAQLKAQLSKDELAIDNTRYAVANIRAQVRVLCVDSGDTSEVGEETDIRTGTYYAARAMRLKARGDDSPMRVIRINTPDLSAERLNDFDLIVLADIDDLAPEMVTRLRTFVSQGGGLFIFMGDQVDAELYNKRFGFDAAGLLPGELLGQITATASSIDPNAEAVEDAELDPNTKGWPMVAGKTDHRLAGIVRRLPEGFVDSARFTKAMKIKPAADSQTILTLAHKSMPLLVEKTIGEGSILLCTSSADRSWNDFAIHAMYPMLLQQAATQLTSRPDERQITVGDAADILVPGREAGRSASLTNPSGDLLTVKVTQRDNHPVCELDTNQIGIYAIAADASIPADAAAVAANIDAQESNVRVVDGGALRKQLSPIGVQVITDQSSIADTIDASRHGRELASILILAGLIVFILQSVLARYFTRRQNVGQEDIGETLQLNRVAAARRT
jgi:hypothetical protein